MTDRKPTYKNRITLTFEDGTVKTATWDYADVPIVAGTPLNKANLLSDTTADALLPNKADPTVNDAFAECEARTGYYKCTVPYSGWPASADSSGLYSQTVACEGMTAGMALDAPKTLEGSTVAQKKLYQKALQVIASGLIVPGEETLTFKVPKKTVTDIVVYIRKAAEKKVTE